MNECSICIPACQKGAPDPVIDDCEPPCFFWELNSVSQEE